MGGDDTRLAAGLLADRYRLGALLGCGGAGRVYEALDIALGRPVAVKVFQGDGNGFGRYRFAAEARLLASLSHPGLVTVHDVCLDGDEPFLVMELVDGPTLRDLLDRGPFEPVAAARAGARLAEVLAHVHAHDVVHRDIKPSNVLVDQHGDCRLTDFGVARALGAAHLTATGEFVGTAAYLAPEQVTDVEVGPAADVYALGLLLLECLTGRTEYVGSTVETALARLHRQPRVPGELPAPWRALLTAMTARDPAHRPDSAECARRLAAIAEGRAVVPSPVPAGPADRARPRFRAVHAGVTTLALAAVCAVAAATTGSSISGRPVGDPRHVPSTSENVAVVERPASPTTSAPGSASGSVSGPATAAPRRAPVPAGPEARTRPGPDEPHGKANKGPGKHSGKGKGPRPGP